MFGSLLINLYRQDVDRSARVLAAPSTLLPDWVSRYASVDRTLIEEGDPALRLSLWSRVYLFAPVGSEQEKLALDYADTAATAAEAIDPSIITEVAGSLPAPEISFDPSLNISDLVERAVRGAVTSINDLARRSAVNTVRNEPDRAAALLVEHPEMVDALRETLDASDLSAETKHDFWHRAFLLAPAYSELEEQCIAIRDSYDVDEDEDDDDYDDDDYDDDYDDDDEITLEETYEEDAPNNPVTLVDLASEWDDIFPVEGYEQYVISNLRLVADLVETGVGGNIILATWITYGIHNPDAFLNRLQVEFNQRGVSKSSQETFYTRLYNRAPVNTRLEAVALARRDAVQAQAPMTVAVSTEEDGGTLGEIVQRVKDGDGISAARLLLNGAPNSYREVAEILEDQGVERSHQATFWTFVYILAPRASAVEQFGASQRDFLLGRGGPVELEPVEEPVEPVSDLTDPRVASVASAAYLPDGVNCEVRWSVDPTKFTEDFPFADFNDWFPGAVKAFFAERGIVSRSEAPNEAPYGRCFCGYPYDSDGRCTRPILGS